MTETLKNESGSGTSTSPPARAKKKRVSRFRRISTWLLIAGLLACTWKLVAEVTLWRAQAAIDSRNHRTAKRWLTVARFTVPVPVIGADRGELYFQSARLNRRLERFDRVSDDLRRALSYGWDAEAIKREQWIALAQTGRFDRMSSHLADLLTDAGSEGPEICKAYVGWLLSRFQLASAHHVIDVWQSDFTESAEPYFQRGRIYSVTQNWPGAVEQFSEALKRDQFRTDARLMRAEALIHLVRFAEALTDLKIFLKAVPHVQTAGNVRRRNHNAVGFIAALWREVAALFPVLIPASFYVGGLECLFHEVGVRGCGRNVRSVFFQSTLAACNSRHRGTGLARR